MRKAKAKHRVLVVEDDRTSRILITRILEEAGYDVLDCSEGRDALHMAELNPPRAMVIDVMLPDMQGTEIVEEISYQRDCRFVKCLFLTSILSKKPSDKSYYFEVNRRRYRALSKPIRKSELLKHLTNAVEASLHLEQLEKDAGEPARAYAHAQQAALLQDDEEELEGEAISLITDKPDSLRF